ncbi:MAG: CHAT domain-containing protein [Cyanobacteria bacterium P01_H01_bin.150]
MKKILILGANPKDTSSLRLDEEVREIKKALQLSPDRDDFLIITESAVQVDDLISFLSNNQPTIVHFAGHGSGADGLAFEDNSGQMQLVSTQALAKLFDSFGHIVECVLLNACYSESQATAIHQHIDCVIGMNKAIGDTAAIKFSVGFYTALWSGRSYEDCFRMGCISIDLQGIPEYLTPLIKIRRRYQGEQPSYAPTSDKDDNFNNFEKPSQSFSISGGQLSDVQVGGIAGQNMNVTQNQIFGTNESSKPLTQPDVVELITQLEELFRNSDLPPAQTTKAIKHLEAAKEEAQEKEPDKDFAAKNLQRATKVLKEAGETVEARTSLWKRVQPIITKLLPWLGVASSFFI